MNLKSFPIYILASVVPATVLGQSRDTLKVDEINVVRAFEPEVNLVSKVDFPPNLPKLTTTDKPTVQKYSFNDFYNPIKYAPEDLRPVKYNPPTTSNESIGYLRTGFGNYLTPVVNLALVNKNHSKFRTGLNADFIHSKSKTPLFRQYYNLGIKGFGEYHLENLTIGAKVGLDMDQYYLYGMSEAEAVLTDKKDISRRYTVPQFGLYLYNHSTNRWNLNFAGNLDVDIAQTDFNNKGTNVNYGLHAFREFSGDTYKAGLDIDGQYSSNTTAERDFSTMAVAIRPYGAIKKNIWSLELGPVLIIDGGDVHLLPSIKNRIKIKGDQLVMYNEWNSKVGYNNLVSVYRNNPFIANSLQYSNYRFQERIFLGLRGALPAGLSYDVRFGQNVWSDVPLFVNDTANFKQFVQVYDEKVSAWNGHLEIEYEKAGQYGAKAGLDYFSYSTKTQAAAWHLPEFKFSLAGKYIWNEKLFVGAEVITLGGIKVRNPQLDVEKLKPQVDINLSANYQLNKNIGFFVELNNLLNNQQPRWNQYERFGFHGIGGVKIVF